MAILCASSGAPAGPRPFLSLPNILVLDPSAYIMFPPQLAVTMANIGFIKFIKQNGRYERVGTPNTAE